MGWIVWPVKHDDQFDRNFCTQWLIWDLIERLIGTQPLLGAKRFDIPKYFCLLWSCF